MKLMVTGIGGIGGYIASILCAYYDNDVTLIARNKRKDSLLESGLVLHSDYFGEHVFHPRVTSDPGSSGIQDVIFVCVKNYSLAGALTAILPCIDEHTIIVLNQNGVDHAAVTRKFVSQGHIVDSTIYMSAAYNDDYSICQFGKFARIYIGSENDNCNKVIQELLNHEGLKCHVAPDMAVELWNKYITNCAYNVITTYYNSSIGEVFAQPEGKKHFHTLIEEAYTVGKAMGVNLSPDLINAIYDRVMAQKDKSTTSSLARDIVAHKQSELETFSGYLVRTAHELRVPVPLSERFYEEIKKRLI